jgi:hypothetical protein
MRYSIEQVNEILKRPDVAEFLEERRKVCVNCGREVLPTHDAHFIILLKAATEDPRGERGGSMVLSGRWNSHIDEYLRCYGDGDFRRRTNKKNRLYDQGLVEFYVLLATGEISKGENGRWTFETKRKTI